MGDTSSVLLDSKGVLGVDMLRSCLGRRKMAEEVSRESVGCDRRGTCRVLVDGFSMTSVAAGCRQRSIRRDGSGAEAGVESTGAGGEGRGLQAGLRADDGKGMLADVYACVEARDVGNQLGRCGIGELMADGGKDIDEALREGNGIGAERSDAMEALCRGTLGRGRGLGGRGVLSVFRARLSRTMMGDENGEE
jgi:hypothetical protein